MSKAAFARKLAVSVLAFSLLISAASFTRAAAIETLSNVPLVAATAQAEGIRFNCTANQLPALEGEMVAFLAGLNIAERYVKVYVDSVNDTLTYTLATPSDDYITLDFFDRPEYQLTDTTIHLPLAQGRTRKVEIVSQKEILLALMQHGRLTEFGGAGCSIEALKDHIGIRQNIVAWAEVLEFVWPDGGPAKWNEKYWKRGTPVAGVPLHVAVNDMFMHQKKYEIGCYTVTKMVEIQGVLDYFYRVKKDPAKLKLVEQLLLVDGEPLVDVEPGRVWDFESDFDPKELTRPGKLLSVKYGIAPKNFVPGDWSYLLNTDPETYQKTGYEGSNAVYLGRGRFDDYYNDHNHSYSYRQKMHEVYQWRNHVFSGHRDAAKVIPLTAQDVERLGHTPAENGIVLSLRISPFLFGYQSLPADATAL